MGFSTLLYKWNRGNWFRKLTRKSTPVANDVLVIEDSAESYAKKYALLGDAAGVPGYHAATHITDGGDTIANCSGTKAGLMSAAQKSKLDGIETAADVTDSGNVTSAGAVMKSIFTEKGDILSASAASTPVAIAHGTAGDVLLSGGDGSLPAWTAMSSAHGNLTGGSKHAVAVAATSAGFMSAADKTKLDAIEALADVTDATNVTSAGAIMKTLLTEKGDIISASAASTPVAIAHGTAGDVLVSGGDGALPAWTAVETAHGNLTGGSKHAAVVAGVSNGFMTAAQATTLTTIGNDHVVGVATGLDLVDDTDEVTAVLSGALAKRFIPTLVHVKCTAKVKGGGGEPVGDSKICIGSGTGTSDILAATTLTGLVAVDGVYEIPIAAGLAVSVAGNGTLYVQCDTEDSGAPDTFTATVTVMGFQV